MTMHFKKLHFRNDILDWWSIFLLPAISVVQFIFKPQPNELMCYAFLNTLPTLLFYRFDLSFTLFIFSSISFNLFLVIYFQTLLSLYLVLLLITTNGLSFVILRFIPSAYTRCFTFVEFSIIVQPLIYYVVRIFQFTFYSLGFGVLELRDNFQSKTSLVCLTCYSSLLFGLILSKLHHNSLLKSLCYLVFLPVFLYGYLWKVLSKEPLSWLLQLILADQTRITLFSIWLTILLATCIFVFFHTYHSDGSTTTVTRKLFHFSISLVYLCGIKYDVQFLEFSSKLILFVFIYIEILRLENIYWISEIINQIFDRFRDEKDAGILTLTHIYLLIGCSTPLWLSTAITNESKLLLASGVVTVGIGDTFASLGGHYFGKHKWPNSNKSYEGTFCSFVSQIIALVCLYYFNSTFLFNIPLVTMLKFILISLISSLVETFTAHVDNLILPLIQYALILLLF